MLPLALKMSAFGPFPGQQKIDFTRLGQNPLFLINGPTGAGKTTILDAICYALYGETTGNERDGRDMRCDYAEPGQLTEIELVFELAKQRYRIFRKPEQLRPKSRGDGYTTEKAEAGLWRLDDDKEELLASQKISDVNREIIQLTGLSAQQFRQVMVLPQGKFRDLLLAPSEEREKIFQQLFQTHIYSRLQDKLKAQARELSQAVETQKHKINALLDSLGLESIDQLTETIDKQRQLLKEQQTQRQSSDKQWEKAQKDLNAGVLLDKSFQELTRDRKIWEDLVRQENDFQEMQGQLDNAHKAQELVVVYQEYQRRQQSLKEITSLLSIQQEKLKNSYLRQQRALDHYQQVKQQAESLDKLKQQLHQLQSFQQRAELLQQAIVEAIQLKSEADNLQAQVQNAQQISQQSTDTIKRKEAERQAILEAIEPLAEALVNMEKLQNRCNGLAKYRELEKTCNSTQRQFRQAEDNLQQCEQQLHQQRSRQKLCLQLWQNGQAGLLSKQLHDDQPCPVCGSRQHPHPAEIQDLIPSDEELNELEQSIRHLEKNRDKAKSQLDKLSADLDGGKRRLEELSSEFNLADNVDEIEQHTQDLQQKIALMEAQKSKLPDVKQINQLKYQEQQGLEKLKLLQQRFNDKQTQLSVAENQVGNYQAELPEAYREVSNLEKELQETQLKITNLEQQFKSATEQAQQTENEYSAAKAKHELTQKQQSEIETRFNQAKQDWEGGLNQSIFKSEQDFLLNRKEAEEINHLTIRISQYQERLSAAKKTFDEKQLQLEDLQPPDLEQLQLCEKNNRRAKDEADTVYHQTLNRLDNLQKQRDSILILDKKRLHSEGEYQLIGYLAQVSNGKNAHNLSLQRFVLSVLLDDVLIEAGQRLGQMSKGRYRLLRKETIGDRRLKSGLELEVEDAYTGKLRPVATLSGGESFMAALSLALGLSDVVQAYAGGIRLDTLFVDEGFGSLDPESLDLAINTLIDLQRSGRMVGIISHVPELKERIDIRLDLNMTKKGSGLAVVLP